MLMSRFTARNFQLMFSFILDIMASTYVFLLSIFNMFDLFTYLVVICIYVLNFSIVPCFVTLLGLPVAIILDNSGIMDLKMNEFVLDEKPCFRILGLSLSYKLGCLHCHCLY